MTDQKNRAKRPRAELEAEYIERLLQVKSFIESTPSDQMPTDNAIGKRFNTSHDTATRARYMIANQCTAQEAIAAVRLNTTQIKAPKDTLAHESLSGEFSLKGLTQAWRMTA